MDGGRDRTGDEVSPAWESDMTDTTITIEQLEAMALRMESDDATERSRLLRLIRAYARILSIREPAAYPRRATECGDEAGHYDSSYPPRIEYRARIGPALVRVRAHATDDIATSSGFYYHWRRVTTDAGLYVARDGRIYGCDESGTGRVGQYAAHPGDCDVDVSLDWSSREISGVSMEELREVERHMRHLAFPASARSEAVAS